MIKVERENWRINIENAVRFIISEIGEEAVASILYKYRVNFIDQIASTDLSEVFNELYAIEVELRSE